MNRRLAVYALFSCTLPLLSAADWPSWLGPDRDGKSPESGFVTAWKKGSLTPVWSSDPGAGYASVAVVDGVVYTLGTQAGSDKLLTYDAKTGAAGWSYVIDTAYVDDMGYHGPRATPTVAGDRVVVMGGNGVIAAVSTSDGTELWSRDVVKQHGGKPPQWGYSGSPLVDDGVVYVDIGGGKGKSLLALSLETGRKVWQTGDDPAGYSSPIRATLGGRDQIVFFTGKRATGLDVATGEPIWGVPWRTSYQVNAATPLTVSADQLFIASGYGTGAALLDLQTPGAPQKVWTSKRMRNKLATSVLHEGAAYGFDEGSLAAIELAQGTELWHDDSYGRGTLVWVEDHLVVLSESCSLSLVRPDRKKLTVVAGPTPAVEGAPCWTVPALSDGLLYVRSPNQLQAFAAR